MTLARKKILAISGSTKQQSTNLNLIKAIAELSADQIELMLYDGLSNLPHFNPDMDDKNVSGHVKDFRQLLQSVDGVLICTPEYAMGLPGTLKNAIDWTVSYHVTNNIMQGLGLRIISNIAIFMIIFVVCAI